VNRIVLVRRPTRRCNDVTPTVEFLRIPAAPLPGVRLTTPYWLASIGSSRPEVGRRRAVEHAFHLAWIAFAIVELTVSESL